MKHTRHHIAALLVVSTMATNGMAQRGCVAAGGVATGPGGSMSYSTGQVDYLRYSSPQGSISLGLQQPFLQSLPLVLEIPNTIVSGNDILCFNAEQTVVVAGEGKNFTVEPDGFAEIIAGRNILIKEGTTVEAGGYLHAYISTIGCAQPDHLVAEKESMPAIAGPVFESEFQNGFFKVYPNPTTGDFTLELHAEEEASLPLVEIFTVPGHLIFSREMPSKRLHALSLSERQPGMYIIRVVNKNKIGTARIIKR